MRALLITHLQNARQSMRSNRLRSLLTMLGITIGVASITTILSLGAGASSIVSSQVDALGGNIAVVRPGNIQSGDPLQAVSQVGTTNRFATSTLSESDLVSLQSLPHVKAVAPLMVLSGSVLGASSAPANTPIVATSAYLKDISKLEVREGQFLDPNLVPSTAVIGPQLAIDLFGTEESVGKSVRIRGEQFTIVGVLQRANDPINYNGVDFDGAVLINLESGRALNQGALNIQQINIQSESVVQLEQVIIEANKVLLKNHFNEVDFTVLSGSQIAQPTSQMFTAIAGVSVAIAAISLTVGGIGIMNIMLVSVAERTREIGIRKALGATNGDIVWQFLIESLALSIGGGVAGYLFGYALAFAISTFLTFNPILNWEIAATALGVSFITGSLFGLYPAIKASKKDAISALRQYE